MQIHTADWTTSARNVAECPDWPHPEFAFIGRSNVGKSSLINALANKSGLAKVSSTPGKTRLLNFFLINKQWAMVDLPGYGFAQVAKHEAFNFAERVGDYLEQRENLRQVFVLIDSRLTPQRIDLDFLAWLDGTGVPFALVFTKTDKQSAAKTQACIAAFQPHLAPLANVPPILTSSTVTRAGRNEILRSIEARLAI